MRRALRALLLACLLAPALPGPAPGAGPRDPGTLCSAGRFSAALCIRPAHQVYDTCAAIGSFARTHGIDPHFFARLLWQESRFDPNALSPAAARGIAQFIDRTAARRGLTDSLNPAEALEYSAHYLGELTRRFGNPGLAAAAYNAGEARTAAHVREKRPLPPETRDYVRIITGLSAETWRDAPPEAPDFRLDGAAPFEPACRALARTRRLSPYPAPERDHAPWGVQLAFGPDAEAARAAFRARTRACRALAESAPLELVSVAHRVAGRQGYVMARLGVETPEAAGKLCDGLRARGCRCAVHENP
ncbi:lytic transglycosylase domain-containing protein [Roseivivax sp. GX 12232]|uniref:lytic transglycosylase domain-containing protein n=1 Tax=Roseivivax sp. GX 12232 TaxID=2900547 RepID=UPI001E6547A4|nr:lytic transglycosylase domain-containing protein [Roseivivax sp. GX 12232]MCE0505149.1 lytic transglycosylase domain-containing protein [Roseivivax sp. GX 12232]